MASRQRPNRGGIYSKAIQDYANQVYAEGPLKHYFIPDGKSLLAMHPGDEAAVLDATAEMISWGEGQSIFLPNQVKLFADGAMYSQLMQMRDGYTDGHDGEWIMYPEDFTEGFNTYWDAGYQIHIHTNGDGGLDLVLTALEAAMRRKPRFDHRTTIVHFGFAAEDQINRLASLGAVISANPYYVEALGTRYSQIGIGAERTQNMVPLQSVARTGMPIAFHSDMPMAPARPLALVETAVTRLSAEGETIGAHQRLDVATALKGITIDAAYSIQLENEIGSITPGKFANFAVLDSDPFLVDPENISSIGIWGTVFEGRVQPAPVHSTPSKQDEASVLPQSEERSPRQIVKVSSSTAHEHEAEPHGDTHFHIPRAILAELARIHEGR